VYYTDLTDLLTIRFYPMAKLNSLEIRSPGRTISMKPHGTMNIGLGFNYRFLGLGFSVGLPASAESNATYGRTSRFDLQASYYGKRLAADGYFQNYKGYYMDKPWTVTTWNEEHYPQAEDLIVSSIGGSAFYLFNWKKFSYKAAYLRNQIQEKSAGSLATGLYFFADEIESESGLIPESVPSALNEEVDILGFQSTSIGVMVGYLYTFVIREKFYVNLGLLPGVGFKSFVLEELDGDRRPLNTSGLVISTRIAMGYEFKRFYLGAQAHSIVRNLNYEKAEINLGTGQIRLIVGTRFDIRSK
jgi:hypothetical protein